MTAFLKRHLPIVAAIAVLILGGAVAAMAAGSAGSPHHHARKHTGGARRLLQSAAAYTGIPLQTLAGDLRAGKSLGQIAVEAGKTEAGLVKALTATASAGTEQRIGQLVKRPGGLHARHGVHKGGMRLLAARYLGLAPAALRGELHAGKTLADIANSTPGRSSAGLISTLVAAREAQLSTAGESSKKSPTFNAARSARLRTRVSAFVERSHPKTAKQKSGG